ncbi:MAG: hypothetical protein M3011_13140, partial [Actinomycetota bacterium]|nr:hypothetical protein [Actinomycetota bacterium]
MRTRKIFATALLTLTVLGGTANAAFARQGRGADDPAGRVRGGHGADDPAGHVRGADDGPNH